jgi:DNA polymerase-3 subunit epsilon/CBS domain-containing protein
MDLKMGGIMPLFSTARVLSIKHGIRRQSTPARFDALTTVIGNMQDTLGNLREAHRIIFQAILEQQLRDLEAGIPLSNRVAPSELTPVLREQLSWGLKQVPNVSNLLGDPLAHG